MANATDLKVIEAIKEGNTAAYTILIDKYKNMVFTLAFNILLNREDAEELTQDAFVKAFNALSNFKAESLFSTWLYRIVINASLNKKKLNNVKLIVHEKELENHVNSSVNDSFKQQEKSERKKVIQAAIRLLKENERVCITLFYLNELSLAEINELTSISIQNIKILLHRGRKNLYQQLSILLKAEIKNLI